MNNMRKLMEMVEDDMDPSFDGGVRYDPLPGDDEPLEDPNNYTRQYGTVTAKFMGDEVTLSNGHGQNMFLSLAEWKDFAGEIKDIFI